MVTDKGVNISVFFAILFTLGYFVVGSIIYLDNVLDISAKESLKNFLLMNLLPIPLIACWYICLECYIRQELWSQNRQNDIKSWLQVGISVAVIVFLGGMFWSKTMSVMAFIDKHWNYIGELYGCIVIKAAIAFIWLFFWIYSIVMKRRIVMWYGTQKKKIVAIVLVFLLLLLLSDAAGSYAQEQGENAWYRNVIEGHYNL